MLTVVILFLVFPNLPITGEFLDIKNEYSFEEAMASLDAYGADGRSTYLWVSLGLDTLFPLIYVTFFAGVIYRFKLSEGTWWLVYVPVFGGVWDLLENIQISAMLVGYPDISEMQVAWASTFTMFKHGIGAFYLVIAVVLVLISLVRKSIAKFRTS